MSPSPQNDSKSEAVQSATPAADNRKARRRARAMGSSLRGSLTRSRMRELGALLTTGFLGVMVAVVTLKLWNAQLNIPFWDPAGDPSFYMSIIKGIADQGWFFTNSGLGAPAGQVNYDFSNVFGDFYNLLQFRAIALFTSNPVVILNTFFLLGFAMIAMASHLVLRSLKLPLLVCTAGSLIFVALPFHYMRNEGHLLLSAYWSVPLGCWLVLGTLGHVRISSTRSDLSTGLRRYATWVNFRTFACCAVVAGAGIYNALFTVLLLFAAIMAAVVARGNLRALLPGGLLVVLILGFVGLYTAPTMIYQHNNGINPAVGQRSPVESEVYGLRAIQLLLPTPQDRIEKLARPSIHYTRTTILGANESGTAALGIVLSLAFLFGVGACLLGWRSSREFGPRTRLVRDAGFFSLVAFLLGTVGGGSALIAYLISPQIRGWNRISVMIGFFAMVVLAVGLEALLRSNYGRGKMRTGPVLASLVAVVCVFGIWEQSSPAFVPTFAQKSADWKQMGSFVQQVENKLPSGSMVLQLPYVPFPENPAVFGMNDYDHLRPYLRSRSLRWTYGSMKGRPADWMAQAHNLSDSNLIRAAAIAGFNGVWIDRNGFADKGASLEKAVRRLTGEEPMQNAGGREVVYSLSSLRSRLTASTEKARQDSITDALLRPIVVQFTSGFSIGTNYSTRSTTAGSDAELKIDRPDAKPRMVEASFTVKAPAARGAEVVLITLPDGKQVRLRASRAGTVFRKTFKVQAGADVLRLHTSAPAFSAPEQPFKERLKLEQLTFTDASITGLPNR